MKDDRILLIHIKTEITFLQKISAEKTFEDLRSDDYFAHAVLRAIEVIGEASKNLSPALKEAYPAVEWREIGGMRDKVVHRYFEINWEIIWNVISTEIPVLERHLTKILSDLESQRNRGRSPGRK